MWRPSGAGSMMRTTSPRTSAFSIGTIVSAPAGIGAPVAIREASCPPTVDSGRRPISARPTIFSSTGWSGDAPAMSEDRTANPSIALEAKSGMSWSATTSSASTHPYASVSGTWREPSGRDGGQDPVARLLDRDQSLARVVVVDVRVVGHRGSVYRGRRRSAGGRAATTASRAGRSRRGTGGSPRRRPRVRWRAPPSPSGSRACCPRRTGRGRTSTRTRPAAAPAG